MGKSSSKIISTPVVQKIQTIPKHIRSWNIVFTGNQQIGKSCIAKRIVQNSFIQKYTPTIAVDVSSFQNQQFLIKIFDASGQIKFHSIVKNYIEKFKPTILIFDVTNKKSLFNVLKYLNTVTYPQKSILVANKIDLKTKSLKKIKDQADYWKIIYLQVSAKTGQNIQKLKQLIIKKIKQQQIKQYQLEYQYPNYVCD